MTKKFKDAFLAKYPESEIILKHFEAGTGHCPEWNKMTRTNLLTFVRYLKEKVAPSSARTYAAIWKSLLNDYKEDVAIPCKRYDEILTLKRVKSIEVYITEKEVDVISKYAPRDARERYVRNIFLLGCLTGARHSDCVTFNSKNISGSHLIYVAEKTKTKVSVPLSQMAVRLIEELSVCTKVNESNYNAIIRKICAKLKIGSDVKVYKAGRYAEGAKWQYIASHTARRSFATNLYLRGADLYSISKMMGHADTQVTEGYICCGLREQSDAVLRYFKKFT